MYRSADKSLARPGRKQANVSARMAWISFGALSCRRKKNLMTVRVSMLLKSPASLTCFRACFLPGRAKGLSAPRYRITAVPDHTHTHVRTLAVGLLWKRDRPIAETSTGQENTHNIYPCFREDSTPQSQQVSGSRPRGHSYRLYKTNEIRIVYFKLLISSNHMWLLNTLPAVKTSLYAVNHTSHRQPPELTM